MKISIVIPSYNEERNVTLLFKQLKKVLGNSDYELIFVDDGSKDGTYKELKELAKDKNVKLIRLQRNFINMIRDQKSKALISNDVAALNKYKLERDRIRKIENLSKEVREIKKVLTSVCERLDRIESI